MKKYNLHISVDISAETFNLIGNLLFVPNYGAIGAAISTGLSYIVFFVTRTAFSKRLYNVNYNLKKFNICIMALYILAIYSSFHSLDFIVVLLGLGISTLICLLYQDVICEGAKMVQNIFKKE